MQRKTTEEKTRLPITVRTYVRNDSSPNSYHHTEQTRLRTWPANSDRDRSVNNLPFASNCSCSYAVHIPPEHEPLCKWASAMTNLLSAPPASQTQYEPEPLHSGSSVLSFDNILYHPVQLHSTLLGAQDHATTCDIIPITAASTVGPIYFSSLYP